MTENLLENPAETMRRAAAQMRERAEAATPGPWKHAPGSWLGETYAAVLDTGGIPQDPTTWLMATGRGGPSREADAVHAASWHPLVALAVADWLDREAALLDAQVFPQSDPVMERYPLAVARTYLDGREAS